MVEYRGAPATATFTNETASGWQQVDFSTPVAIAADTFYVASYHTNVGHYSYNFNYFTSQGVDSPPLHALSDGVFGVNGVYRYGSSSAFPNLGWDGSNFWVDVAFRPAVTLTSIAVTSGESRQIQFGRAQQFTATEVYSDGSTSISATNGIKRNTTLTVLPPRLAITKSSLATGTLPTGLTLSAQTGSSPGRRRRPALPVLPCR